MHSPASHHGILCYAFPFVAVPDTDSPSPPASARTFWQRKILDPIVAQLTQGLTPQKIALTIAIGSAIAMFPILGTTTLICLVVGVFMKLNQPILQMVNYACTPIHIPFIFFAFKWGEKLFGVEHSVLEARGMRRELIAHPWEFIQRYSLTGLHAIEFWAILVPIWAVTVYYISLPILRGIERARLAALAKSAEEKAKDHPVP
jgi:uncharacterized protein (DUF2062 family)